MLPLVASLLVALQDPQPLFEVHGRAVDDGFGFSLAGGGDMDADGTADIVVGAFDILRVLPVLGHKDDPTVAGSVSVLSGRDGKVLLVLEAEERRLGFGAGVAVIADVDGDGRAEVAVAAPHCSSGGARHPLLAKRRGAVVVHSGADGDVLDEQEDPQPSAYAWTSLASCGDLDGDGGGDLAVGIAAIDDGHAVVRSTRDGRELLRVRIAEHGFGSAIADAGDIDGDGVRDLVVGAPQANRGELWSLGAAVVVSGKTGAPLRTLLGPAAHGDFGSSVAGLGDVDGDGRSDLVIGARNLSRAAEHAGAVFVHSGASGELLFSLDGARAGASFGHAVCALGDVDGDGCPDFAASTNGPEARTGVHSGKDGVLLVEYPGSSVALAGDVDGDGRPDLVTGAMPPGARGVVRAWSPARDLAR